MYSATYTHVHYSCGVLCIVFIPQESDYLHLIYHLYDSESSESEPEEERQKRERLAKLHDKLQSVIELNANLTRKWVREKMV